MFNLQKPMFADRRVRQALAMLWDFEWSNRQMMRGMYIRQQSYFSNTPLAASELPDAQELKILEPLRDQVPDEVFNKVFEAPKTDGSGVIRDKQLQALDLLEQAGETLGGLGHRFCGVAHLARQGAAPRGQFRLKPSAPRTKPVLHQARNTVGHLLNGNRAH